MKLLPSYFESGFNGRPWSTSSHPEVDVFYYDIQAILTHNSFEKTLFEQVQSLAKSFPNLKLIDDGSVLPSLIKKIIPQVEVIEKLSEVIPEDSFIDFCNNKFQIDDSVAISTLYLAYKEKATLIAPSGEVRILNVNYSRTQKKTYGEPYLVYIENERSHRNLLAQKELGLNICWNLVKHSPELFRSYFFHPLIMDWITSKNILEPHNDLVERKLLADIFLKNFGSTPQRLYPKTKEKKEWENKIKRCFPPQQASFPLHVLFDKVFSVPLDINKNERSLYGE